MISVDPSKPHPSTKPLPVKDIKTLANSSKNMFRCTSNFEDTIFEMEALLNEHTKAPESPETKDPEVDILECTMSSDLRLVKDEDPNETEYSSSFGDTVSGVENYSGLSEAEVDSQFCGDSGLNYPFDPFNVFHLRKKKLTSHWRNFIRPLMWRCKWTELKIKEIESQAVKYANELMAYDQRKHSESDQCVLEVGGSKSLPLSSEHCRKRVMKRRKRKRVEATTELASYMSRHHLFSYLEKKRSHPDSCLVPDDSANPDQNVDTEDKYGSNNDQSFFEFKHGDDSLELMLSKIEIMCSRAQKLRAQLETVISQNPEKFSSENLSLLSAYDPQSSGQSPTCTEHMSESDIGDPFMPENVVSNFEETFHSSDIIESTMAPISATNITLHKQQIRDSYEDVIGTVMMHDETIDVKKEPLENASESQQDKHIDESGTSEQGETPTNVSETETCGLKSTLASDLHFPKNKRRRLDRRVCRSGTWSQKQP